MNFTLSKIASSLASYLSPHFTGVTFYQDPLQQAMSKPCMFIQTRGASIAKRMGKRFLWTLRLDLVYLLDFNLVDLQKQYQTAAELLDILLETFPYVDGKTSALIRTYNRDWNIDLDELHYRFELRAWVSRDELYALMRTLEQHMEVIDGSEEV